MNDLFYFIPWPQSQNLIELDPNKEHWSYADSDFESGAFAEKTWYDTITYEDYKKSMNQ